jgi:DNA-directed RNA polymerase subunit M/transcription elongation factor TFIIS
MSTIDCVLECPECRSIKVYIEKLAYNQGDFILGVCYCEECGHEFKAWFLVKWEFTGEYEK